MKTCLTGSITVQPTVYSIVKCALADLYPGRSWESRKINASAWALIAATLLPGPGLFWPFVEIFTYRVKS